MPDALNRCGSVCWLRTRNNVRPDAGAGHPHRRAGRAEGGQGGVQRRPEAFEGDEPTGLQFLRVTIPTFRRDGTKARIVAIFHGNAGYMLLDDSPYARVRNWRGGNPYKEQIAALMREGECGETMRLRGWSNGDLVPNVKVNSGANYRIVQLVQEGFVQLQP